MQIMSHNKDFVTRYPTRRTFDIGCNQNWRSNLVFVGITRLFATGCCAAGLLLVRIRLRSEQLLELNHVALLVERGADLPHTAQQSVGILTGHIWVCIQQPSQSDGGRPPVPGLAVHVDPVPRGPLLLDEGNSLAQLGSGRLEVVDGGQS